MKSLNRRIEALEASERERPMSKAAEEIIRARLLAKVQLFGAGRELPACCKRRDDRWSDPELEQSRERIIARMRRMIAVNEDDREPGVGFIPLPDDELDRLEQFLIETQHHDRS